MSCLTRRYIVLECSFVFSIVFTSTVCALDFGDAPEGSLTYPETCTIGRFPTCVSVGPAGWIQHEQATAWLGASLDSEPNGNGGHCPQFNPNQYNQDECFGDGDAGLLIQPSHTIKGSIGDEFYFTCAGDIFGMLGKTCDSIFWGTSIDLEVHNHMPSSKLAYVNVLVDWNRDGQWSGMTSCSTGIVNEHVLKNFMIPNPYDGKLSSLIPPPINIGPIPGYLWARFSITDEPVNAEDWDGSGNFAVGETEDYLLYVRRATLAPQGCPWQEGGAHKMHWAQVPDMSSNGLDIAMYPNAIADDFLCTESGPIKDIHFWASFKDHCLPPGGVDSVWFAIDLYTNIPATEATAFSQPGELLWSEIFKPGEYAVNQLTKAPQEWFDPNDGTYQSHGDKHVYQYNFCPDNAYEQEEGEIYWLQIRPIYWFLYPSPPVPDYLLGWKTTSTQLHWNGNAVWQNPQSGWQPLHYPPGHNLSGNTLDLAFVIGNGDTQKFGDVLKWSQPPLEWDPHTKTPIFCGWDEPANIYRPIGAGVNTWQLVADDFQCYGSMPVTSIRWWGSYVGWEESSTPQKQPSSWHIIFWNNVSADNYYNYHRPSGPLWQLEVSADSVDEQYVGLDRFPGKPTDACFQYSVKLTPEQYFQQQQYLNKTQDNVFWMSITARYEDNVLPSKPWGWKTRPEAWRSDAIGLTISRDAITENVLLVPHAISPLKSKKICDTDASFDMAFELGTQASFSHWGQAFTGIRQWPHYEDEKSLATATSTSRIDSLDSESIVRRVADDFPCTESLPITSAVWWGSYIGYDYAVCVCQDRILKPLRPSYFLLSLWTDSSDASSLVGKPSGQPGQKVWEYRVHEFDEVLVGYDKHPETSPETPGREPVYRYTALFSEETWFYPKTENDVCWFSVVAVYESSASELVYPWGWTNHAHQFGADAVAWGNSASKAGAFTPLQDQTGGGVDMSFLLFTGSKEPPDQPDQPTSRPISHTHCPALATQCPTVETSCPAEVTYCPPEQTQCPVVQTSCPPRTPTNCPASDTQCPEETRCPMEYTQCYHGLTVCPGIRTTCPPEETRCPMETTVCPNPRTQCRVCIVPLPKGQLEKVSSGAFGPNLYPKNVLTSVDQRLRQKSIIQERICPIVEAQCLKIP